MSQSRWPAVAFVLIVGASGVAACGQPQTTPLRGAHLTLDGATHTTRPPSCSQDQSYRTIDLADRDEHVEAVVQLSGYRVLPQWVKIRNIDGFTGSYYEGGVGSAHADVTNNLYTITGSAYGINNSHPDKVVTTDFKITAEC